MELGNLSFRCQGKVQASGPRENELLIRSTGAGQPVVVKKLL